MFTNHYVRKKLNAAYGDKLSSPFQSMVLNAVPTNELFTKTSLVTLISNSREANEMMGNGSLQKKREAVTVAIDELVSKGFIKLVEGVALERFVDKLK